VARIPDQAENRRLFAQLDGTERRAVIRCVNRGRTAPTRRLAPLAVGVARRQQRFWRYSWLMGPFIGLIQALFVEPAMAFANAMLATSGLLLLSLWFGLRARRAEQLNLEVAEGRRKPGDDAAPGTRTRAGATADGPAASLRARLWPGRRRAGGPAPAGPRPDRGPTPSGGDGHLPGSTGRLNGGDRDDPPLDPTARRTGNSRPAGPAGGAPNADLPAGRRPYQPRRRKRRR